MCVLLWNLILTCGGFYIFICKFFLLFLSFFFFSLVGGREIEACMAYRRRMTIDGY